MAAVMFTGPRFDGSSASPGVGIAGGGDPAPFGSTVGIGFHPAGRPSSASNGLPGCCVREAGQGGSSSSRDACGTVQASFIQPQGVIHNVHWNFVGPGQGRYDNMHSYTYVGEGQGAYDHQVVNLKYGWKLRPFCAVLLFVVVACLCAGLAMLTWTGSSTTPGSSTLLGSGRESTAPPTGAPATPSPPTAAVARVPPTAVAEPARPTALEPAFVCSEGFRNWMAGWSPAKKQWCCANQGKGCEGQRDADVGECLVWGDPHVLTFDHRRSDYFGEGEVWLVQSDKVFIQARYVSTPFTNGLAATEAVAVGGPFLEGHTLKVTSMMGLGIRWDDRPILLTFPSTASFGSFGTITYNDQGHLVDNALNRLPRHIVHVSLPLGVHMQIMRWDHHINIRITMPKQRLQDGHCGNFNQDPGDDASDAVKARIGTEIAQHDLLFHTIVPSRDAKELTLSDCDEQQRRDAEGECKKARADLAGDALHACIFDVCFAGRRYAAQDSVY